MDKFFRDKPPKKYQYGLRTGGTIYELPGGVDRRLFKLGDYHVLDHTGIDLEASYDLILAAADNEAELAFFCFGQAELFVEEPVVKTVLVEFRAILIPYDEVERGALGVGVGDVEYDLVVLYSQVFDGGGILGSILYWDGTLCRDGIFCVDRILCINR